MLRYENGCVWYVHNTDKISPFGYQLSDGRKIIIPDNFKTDFATIPRIFWFIAPPVGYGARAAYGKAAVIHDYLYRNKSIGGTAISRKIADDIFVECMKVSNVHPVRQYIMWLAVRMFGWLLWH